MQKPRAMTEDEMVVMAAAGTKDSYKRVLEHDQAQRIRIAALEAAVAKLRAALKGEGD